VPEFSGTLANGNFNTGVEQRLQNLIGGPFPDRPIDAGFGVVPDPALFGPDDMVPNDDGSFGDRNFNAQSVIEAADTVPSFHNNLTALAGAYSSTIEDAVAFYTTDEFEVTVPPGMVVLLDSEPMDNADPNPLDQRVLNIGRLLRSLNAMENARSASSFASRAQELGDAGMDEVFIARALDLAIRDSKDGIVVQEEVGLNPASVDHFNTAIDLINQALDSGLPWQDRSDLIDQALDKLDSAKTDIAI
jgi:hypothetical protein